MHFLKIVWTVFAFHVLPSSSWAYTSIISSTDFDGVRTDVNTTAIGIISVLIIVLAVGVIARCIR